MGGAIALYCDLQKSLQSLAFKNLMMYCVRMVRQWEHNTDSVD
jgi:hypothetical protein